LFRTGFTRKDSYIVAKNVISDYENTKVGYMRNGIDTRHGTQPSDPSKLAAMVVKLGHTENPPLHLPIGTDSINNYKIYTERLANDVNARMKDSLSTDYNPR
jgi:hypothetical protein